MKKRVLFSLCAFVFIGLIAAVSAQQVWKQTSMQNDSRSVDTERFNTTNRQLKLVSVADSPASQAEEGDAIVALVSKEDWLDLQCGYQMLITAGRVNFSAITTLSQWGDMFMTQGKYGEFEYKIPENADEVARTINSVFGKSKVNTGRDSIAISIPAGTYDYAVVSPIAGWVGYGTYVVPEGTGSSYVFEAGRIYVFEVLPNYETYMDKLSITILDEESGLPACDAPADLSTQATSSRTASILWSGDAANYNVAVLRTEVAVNEEPASYVSVSSNSCLLDTLQAHTTYYVYVQANCSNGVKSSWVTTSFTTPDDVPGTQSAYFYDMGFGTVDAISPNGKIIIGTVNVLNGTNGYYIDMPDVSTFQPDLINKIPNSIVTRDVNDNGDIVATREETFDGNTFKIPAIYRKKNGVYQWYSVGKGRFKILDIPHAPTDVKCIDAAGNAYGSIHLGSNQTVAFRWKYNAVADNYTQDTMAYAQPALLPPGNGDTGSKIASVSSDGAVASGFDARKLYGGNRRPVFWATPETYEMMDETVAGQADAVSPNGKYIALSKGGKAAIYNVETKKYTVFGPDRSRCNAVSDNGIVVGVHPRGYYSYDGNQAFIWSEELGFMYFRQFLDRYAADANIEPVDIEGDLFFDFPNDRAVIDNPTGISADGRIITGWSGYSLIMAKGWVLGFTKDLVVLGIPKNLVANVDMAQRNKVVLTWDAPTTNNTGLNRYHIYRNGVYLDKVAAGTTTFTDSNAPSGYIDYYVAAVYADDKESNGTNIARATIVDSYAIPFAEDFESGEFETNFWKSEDSMGSSWQTYPEAGFKEMFGALFMAKGNKQPFNVSLTSKPFDAAGHNKVILTFMYLDTVVPINSQAIPDTIYVEVGTGGNWTKVQTIVLNNHKWTPVTLDISSAAANKLFQVRFRAQSGSNSNFLNFDIDDFGIAFEEATAPSDLIAYRYKNSNKVNLIYRDASGSYGLSYTNGLTYDYVGNYGHSLLAVNKYETSDLEPLKGKYFTSVSAFLWDDDPDAPAVEASKFKLVVYVNGVRVDNSDVITLWKRNAWNNFPLAHPILLTGTETILAGLEIVEGGYVLNRPLCLDGDPVVNTKGNLYSEDDGQTWLNAHDAGLYGNWLITANIRDEATAQPVDDDPYSVLYMVYRNGVALNTQHYGQRFVDNNPVENGCYSVKVFRSPGGLSPMSEQTCNILNLGTKIATVENSGFAVYPNPAKDVIRIAVDFQTVQVLDMSGKMLIQTSDRQVNISSLANGMYILEATLPDGSKAFAKVVKK